MFGSGEAAAFAFSSGDQAPALKSFPDIAHLVVVRIESAHSASQEKSGCCDEISCATGK
jgi:hypothetical protein